MQGTCLLRQGDSRYEYAFKHAVRMYIECYHRSKPKDVNSLSQAIKLAVDYSKISIT